MLPNVATILPLTPFNLYPRNIEMFTANRPGADWEMARMSKNSCSSIHFFLSTTSFWITGTIAYPPPMVKAPILAKQVKISKYLFITIKRVFMVAKL